MRFSKSILVLVSLASVAGCAAPAASVRGADTAVTAEPRHISEATFPDAVWTATSSQSRKAN